MIAIRDITSVHLNQDVTVVGEIDYEYKVSDKQEDMKYIKIMITDNTSNIYSYLFEGDAHRNLIKKIGKLKNHTTVQATGKIVSVRTKDRTQTKMEIQSIDEVTVCNGHTYNLEEIANYLKSQFIKIKDPVLKSIVKKVLADYPEYKEVPYSHNYFGFKGGLVCYLEKMLKTFESISECLDGSYDEDLIRSVIMIHRIGRVKKMEIIDGRTEVTLNGLIGSDNAETMGIVIPVIEGSKLSYEDKCLVKSVIGSTKGKEYWGSSNETYVPEAYLIHQIEQIVLSDAEFDDMFVRNTAGTANLTKGAHGRVVYTKRRSSFVKK